MSDDADRIRERHTPYAVNVGADACTECGEERPCRSAMEAEIDKLWVDLDAAKRLLGKLGHSPSEYLPSRKVPRRLLEDTE